MFAKLLTKTLNIESTMETAMRCFSNKAMAEWQTYVGTSYEQLLMFIWPQTFLTDFECASSD